MIVTRKKRLLATALASTLLSVTAYADEPVVDSVQVSTADEKASFSLGLDAQVRYGLTDTDDTELTSGFRLRRFRPILGFEAFDQFSVSVVPELAGTPELKDGVIGWSPTAAFSLEAGQFAPPFNWERDGSSDYHQFTERSVANREFQIADGRDIGAQFDWEWDLWLDVEAGVFNGAGSNAPITPGTGHVLTGRVAYAPLGAYQEVEVMPTIVDRLVLVVAAGGYYAFDNTWREWSRPGLLPEPDPEAPTPADVWSVTGDLHAWVWRFSVHAQGFFREVRPCCGDGEAFQRYDGAGFTGQASVLLIDERLLAAFRYSWATPDGEQALQTQEMAGALHVFHLGNQSKFTLDGGLIERPEPAAAERYIRLQYQILL